jgi:hypothetical protein
MATKKFGLKKSVGKYIMFIDSDDFILEKTLKIMYETIERENVDIVDCNYFRIESNGFYQHMYIPNKVQTWGKIFKRDIFEKVNYIDFPNISHGEDVVLMEILKLYSPKRSSIPEHLYAHVQHPNRIMFTPNENAAHDIIAQYSFIMAHPLFKRGGRQMKEQKVKEFYNTLEWAKVNIKSKYPEGYQKLEDYYKKMKDEQNQFNLIKDSGMFDSSYYKSKYLSNNFDNSDSENLIGHYLSIGANLEYNPSPHFDSKFYISNVPNFDILTQNPLVHYLTEGRYRFFPINHNQIYEKKIISNMKEKYPRVLSTSETLELIVKKKKSIIRFGDGEFNIILGRGIYYQKYKG